MKKTESDWFDPLLDRWVPSRPIGSIRNPSTRISSKTLQSHPLEPSIVHGVWPTATENTGCPAGRQFHAWQLLCCGEE
ncbi:hypothetical protein [Roseimaritima multifibrata]|uniref:hypothetical protein n=1 Tax=Roseimaritima multifibrata TaxID=1930274 RepID=UPI0011A80C40|nr:hypothetical protein [Roseimaritima multifibrata]